MMKRLKLGVNIDHIATLRQARGERVPEPRVAAIEAVRGGADGITVHLREDRRHIQDHDLPEIRRVVSVPLNLEMALSPEIVGIALQFKPEKVCMVPEKRQELTTEGGLDAFAKRRMLKTALPKFRKKGIEVSLFIDPSLRQAQIARHAGAEAVELHTGAYANAKGWRKRVELNRIRKAAQFAHRLGLKVHAGHGLNYENVAAIAEIPEIEELNIGHAIISHAVLVGMRFAVRQMKRKMARARKEKAEG